VQFFGLAFYELGVRKSDSGDLEAVIAAFRETLKERTRDRVPLDWAWTQCGIGNSLYKLGRQKGDSANVKAAVVAYQRELRLRRLFVFEK
jgi:hypothetical protein